MSFAELSSSNAQVVLIKNIFATAVEHQVAAKLKVVLNNTSFSGKTTVKKEDKLLFSILSHSRFDLVWATRTEMQIHTLLQ